MEWSRAKTILIVTFVILNGLLGYQLWANSSDFAGAYFERAEIRDVTQQQLREKNIRLEAAIPEGTPRLKEVTALLTISKDLAVKLEKKPARPNMEPGAKPPQLVGIEHLGAYQLDQPMSSQNHLIYNQMVGEWPMFEVNLQLFINNGQIIAYTQRYVEMMPSEQQDVDAAEEAETETVVPRVISAHRAVGFLAERYLKENAVITDVQLGYHGQAYEADTQVLAPKWRVALEDGAVYYIHAVNGAVEQKE